jgi:uncharacterized OB-fold protein
MTDTTTGQQQRRLDDLMDTDPLGTIWRAQQPMSSRPAGSRTHRQRGTVCLHCGTILHAGRTSCPCEREPKPATESATDQQKPSQ